MTTFYRPSTAVSKPWVTVALVLVVAGLVVLNLKADETADRGQNCPAAQPGEASGVRTEKSAYLGVSTSPLNEALGRQLGLPRGVGLLVDYVDADSPAGKVIERHDVLHKVDDQVLVSHRQLSVLVRMRAPGDALKLTVVRGGKPRAVKTTLAGRELPALGSRSWNVPHVRIAPHTVHGRNWPTNLFESLGGITDEALQGLRPWLESTNIIMKLQAYPSMRQLTIDPLTGIRTTTRMSGSSGVGVYSLNNGNISLSVATDSAGKKTLTASDAAGEVTFQGPIDTEEQREKVPEPFRAALNELEGMMEKIGGRKPPAAAEGTAL